MVLWTAAIATMMMMTTIMTAAASSPGCPTGCACKWKNGKQTVECVNKKVSGVSGLGIDPATQVLDISDNDLSAAGLPRDTFAAAGLSNLQRIHAARCNVYYVHDHAFRGLTNLVDLDLSGNCLRAVPTGSFAECPSLMKLSLSGNPVGSVAARAFRHLGQLTTLDLSACGLNAVDAGAFDGLLSLDWLKLDDNRLTHVPGPHTLPGRLHGIRLDHNDWQCDCRMIDMHRWLTTSRVPVAEEPVCAGPVPYAGVPIRRMPAAELACVPVAYAATKPVQDVVEGANVSFRCLVASSPAATVEWLFGDAPVYRHNASELITVDGNTTAELYVYNASRGDAGTYACVAQNRAGSTRANFTVTVQPKPSTSVAANGDRFATSPSSSSSSSSSSTMNDNGQVFYIACLVAGSMAVSAVAVVLVAVRCRREKHGGRRDPGTADSKRPVPGVDGYRTVSTVEKEPLPSTAAVTVATTAAARPTAIVTTNAVATAVDDAESNPDVVSDAKRAEWEIDFEQIVWAECPPATGYVSIQIPVQCGIECLGAYYAAAAAADGYGTVRRQRGRAAVVTTAFDDTVQVRTTVQGYPADARLAVAQLAPVAVGDLPSIIVDVADEDRGGGGGVTPILSPPLPFRTAISAIDDDDSIAL